MHALSSNKVDIDNLIPKGQRYPAPKDPAAVHSFRCHLQGQISKVYNIHKQRHHQDASDQMEHLGTVFQAITMFAYMFAMFQLSQPGPVRHSEQNRQRCSHHLSSPDLGLEIDDPTGCTPCQYLTVPSQKGSKGIQKSVSIPDATQRPMFANSKLKAVV